MKKKIALFTWFSNGNYGTILQAYALKTILDKYGNCQIINYKKEKYKYGINDVLNRRKRQLLVERIFEKLFLLLYPKKYRSHLVKKSMLFNEFIHYNLKISDKYFRKNDLSNLKYDYFVTGSDQVWNPYHFDESFYLNFVKSGKRISYAPSFGVNSLTEFGHLKEYIKDCLSKFDNLSVRESEGREIIKDLIEKDATVCLDPTLLINAEEWKDLTKNSIYEFPSKYIYCLFLGDYTNYIEKVNSISAILDVPIYLHCYNRIDYFYKGNRFLELSPIDFIKAVQNADFICTDSFHATVFSIIFQKPFICYRRFLDSEKYSQNSRVENLLQNLNLLNRLDMNFTDSDSLTVLDFTKPNYELEKLKKISFEFLNNSFKP